MPLGIGLDSYPGTAKYKSRGNVSNTFVMNSSFKAVVLFLEYNEEKTRRGLEVLRDLIERCIFFPTSRGDVHFNWCLKYSKVVARQCAASNSRAKQWNAGE
jgi:hypothetical protein